MSEDIYRQIIQDTEEEFMRIREEMQQRAMGLSTKMVSRFCAAGMGDYVPRALDEIDRIIARACKESEAPTVQSTGLH